jgi:hypothetical protein
VQRSFESINQLLSARRDPLDDRVVENMMAGYAFVDALVADGVDLFALGSSKYLLELNTLVLCGTSSERRAAYAGHIEATEHRFYEEQQGGVRDLVEWQIQHRDSSCWSQAAGAFLRILSLPQLFIEGNHRTGALVMSYLLVRENQPPFVLTLENASTYFDPSTVLRDAEKNSPAILFRLRGTRKRLAAFLKEHADRRYLLA